MNISEILMKNIEQRPHAALKRKERSDRILSNADPSRYELAKKQSAEFKENKEMAKIYG